VVFVVICAGPCQLCSHRSPLGVPGPLALTAKEVSVAQQSPGGGEVLTIFDDGVWRPNTATTGLISTESPADKIRWGADASTVYGEAYSDLFTFSIDFSGSKVAKLQSLVFGRGDFLYDRASARLYDIQGNSIDPASGKLIGKFNGKDSGYTTAFTIDGANHLAYYLGRQPGARTPRRSMRSYLPVHLPSTHL